MCYDQFKRIEEIANKYHKQVFVTSHWYGGIPILQNGNLFTVIKNEDNLPSVEMFSLDNYFEKRGDHPNDINLKSFYDFTSSIVSSIRDRKSTRLNCSHVRISYADFCLKKKTKSIITPKRKVLRMSIQDCWMPPLLNRGEALLLHF